MSDHRIARPGANTGMAHLIGQAQQQRPGPQREFPKDRVLRIFVPLAGKTYFVPDGAADINAQVPPFPMEIPLAYSETFPGGTTGGERALLIEKHENMRIFSTGLITDECPMPKWWARRDEGVL